MPSPGDLLSRITLQGPPKVKEEVVTCLIQVFLALRRKVRAHCQGRIRWKMPSGSCRELKPESGSPIPPVLLSPPWIKGQRPREDAEDRKKLFHPGSYSASPFTSLFPGFFQLSPRINVYLLFNRLNNSHLLLKYFRMLCYQYCATLPVIQTPNIKHTWRNQDLFNLSSAPVSRLEL